jgi:hypothetical protein
MTDEPVTFPIDCMLHEERSEWRHMLRELRAPHLSLVLKTANSNGERGYSKVSGGEMAEKTTLCKNMNGIRVDFPLKEPVGEDGGISVRKGDHDESC